MCYCLHNLPCYLFSIPAFGVCMCWWDQRSRNLGWAINLFLQIPNVFLRRKIFCHAVKLFLGKKWCFSQERNTQQLSSRKKKKNWSSGQLKFAGLHKTLTNWEVSPAIAKKLKHTFATLKGVFYSTQVRR